MLSNWSIWFVWTALLQLISFQSPCCIVSGNIFTVLLYELLGPKPSPQASELQCGAISSCMEGYCMQRLHRQISYTKILFLVSFHFFFFFEHPQISCKLTSTMSPRAVRSQLWIKCNPTVHFCTTQPSHILLSFPLEHSSGFDFRFLDLKSFTQEIGTQRC